MHEENVDVLKLLRQKTEQQVVFWIEDDSDSYSATLAGKKLHIDFLYIETIPRGGADRLVVHVYFPGYNAYFCAGSEAYNLVIEVLAAGFDKWSRHISGYGNDALRFLNQTK